MKDDDTGSLISGLRSAFVLTDGKFVKREPAEFRGIGYGGLSLLLDMDKPPEPPFVDFEEGRDPWVRHIFERGANIERTTDPRFGLYIGNSGAVPYLRGALPREKVIKIFGLLERPELVDKVLF